MGPHKESLIICNADTYEKRKEAARTMMDLFNDDYLAGKERLGRAAYGMNKEREAAANKSVIFQKHVVVHTISFAEFEKIDDYSGPDYLVCGTSATSRKSAECMLANNLDHFGECAKKTYQIFHDLAIEEASKSNLNKAYFYEGLGSHSLTDLFSAGHSRTPSKRLRTSHCSALRGGLATNHMHDEDSYNGLFMTNRMKSEPWWVYGDSFYFEPFNQKNRDMMHNALQGSIDEVYAAYQAEGSSTEQQGSSSGSMNVYPGKGLDFVPDVEVSKSNVPDYWDVNTCPMWYEQDGKMYRRFPWYRLRSEKGRKMSDQQPAATKFGLFNYTFPLVDDTNQLRLSGEPDLKVHDCWFKFSPETTFYSNECLMFGQWKQSEMFYSHEIAGFLPPTLGQCQAYTLGGRNKFDNDCYDVLEVVSQGQNCKDLKDWEVCEMLTPRCVWKDNYGPDGITGGDCVQGSCVAFSNEATDIVSGDPTPPVPVPPQGFYMSFQGACAFNTLDAKSYKLMPGKNDINKCAKLCIDYAGTEGECTGIAVDSGIFDECYLYFNNACQKADNPGFARCPSHGLQTFHKGSRAIEDIMSECACKDSWYYKDPNVIFNGCAAVQSESWGNWCYVTDPEACELAMHSTTQPGEGWRYCEESTCEAFSCPNGFQRRDSVICYDDSCDVQDCCAIDPLMKCDDMNSEDDCKNIGCKWNDRWWPRSDVCVEDSICEISETKEECENKGCAWQDGWLSDACAEGICENRYYKEDCEYHGCKWNNVWGPNDYCSNNRRLKADESDEDNWEDTMTLISDDAEIRAGLAPPLDFESKNLSAMLQSKLDAMLAGLMHLEEKEVILFAAFDDGRFYSLKSCDLGPSCWSRYSNPEYTFGVVEPNWNEFINIFKVVSGKVDVSENRISEFSVPDFFHEEFNMEEKIWHDEPGWTSPFTCNLMHPDVTEICEAYTRVGADYTLGIQMLSSENEGGSTKSSKKSKKATKGGKKKGKKSSKSGKKGKSSTKASTDSSMRGKKNKSG